MRFPFPYNAYIRAYTYTLLPVTRTDCRAPELMKCQAQTPLHPSSQLPRPPTVRTKIIITVSRALSHFICSTSVQYILYRYRYTCIWYIRITCTHMHALLKYIQFCIGIYICRYVYLHIRMWTRCDIAIVATDRPNFINISNLILDNCTNHIILLLYLIDDRECCVTDEVHSKVTKPFLY